jgi:hypothetical protein
MLIVYSNSQQKKITLTLLSSTFFPKESTELIELGGFFVKVNILTPPLSAKGHFKVNRVYLLPYLFAYCFV